MKRATLAATVAAAIVAIAQPAAAQQVRATAYTDVASAEEVRGMRFSDSPMVSPGIAIGYGACDADLSASYDTGAKALTSNAAMLNCQAGKANIGLTRFGFLSSGQTEYEVSASTDFGIRGMPTLKAIRNFGEAGKGWYFVVGKQRELEVGGVPVALEAKVAYNKHHYRDETGMSHFEAKAAVPLKYKGIDVTPRAEYRRSFAGENGVLAGVTASYRLRR